VSTFDEAEQQAKLDAFMNAQRDYVEIDPEGLNDSGHLLINWGRKGAGFGQLAFYTRGGVLGCDNECMGRAFCKSVLDKLFEQCAPADECPPLLCRFKSSDALLDAAVPDHVTYDWGNPE
jgi:hypothetical protein